jgi:hypothetical protein
LLRIFNALRARRDGDDVFSKRSDHDAYFWIISNEFDLIKWGLFNQMRGLNWEWLNKFNRGEWWDKKLKIWDVVYASLLAYATCFRRLEVVRLVGGTLSETDDYFACVSKFRHSSLLVPRPGCVPAWIYVLYMLHGLDISTPYSTYFTHTEYLPKSTVVSTSDEVNLNLNLNLTLTSKLALPCLDTQLRWPTFVYLLYCTGSLCCFSPHSSPFPSVPEVQVVISDVIQSDSKIV